MVQDIRTTLGLDNVIEPSTNIIPEIFKAIKAIDLEAEFKWRFLDPSPGPTPPDPSPGPDPDYDEYWRELDDEQNQESQLDGGEDDELFPDEPDEPSETPQLNSTRSSNAWFNEFWRDL